MNKLTEKEESEFDAYLEALDETRMSFQGGYPSARSYEIPGWVVVAGLDHDGEPDLQTLTVEDVRKWLKRAHDLQAEFLRDEGEELGWYDAMLDAH